MRKIHLFLILPLLALACKKTPTPTMSTTPDITFESVAPNSVKAFKDSLVFTIGYKDGDGDLGENNAAATNLFLTDKRINITYKYRLSQLAPTDAKVAIQGKVAITLKSTEITDNSSSQQATFEIYVTDRAGHKSNTVTTGAVTIVK